MRIRYGTLQICQSLSILKLSTYIELDLLRPNLLRTEEESSWPNSFLCIMGEDLKQQITDSVLGYRDKTKKMKSNSTVLNQCLSQ